MVIASRRGYSLIVKGLIAEISNQKYIYRINYLVGSAHPTIICVYTKT
jgi:hypothetical protein